jgi:hypothetical protein
MTKENKVKATCKNCGCPDMEERLLIVLGCKQSGRPLTLQEKMREAANKIKLDI